MPLKCIVYIGTGTLSEHESRSSAHAIVMGLVEDHLDQGRNVTADNFFTSEGLVEELLDHNTTYVGTVRQNNRSSSSRQIEMLVGACEGIFSSLLHSRHDSALSGTSKDVLFCYCHQCTSVHKPTKPGKKESLTIVTTYNRTKGDKPR